MYPNWQDTDTRGISWSRKETGVNPQMGEGDTLAPRKSRGKDTCREQEIPPLWPPCPLVGKVIPGDPQTLPWMSWSQT